jgi:hypothetical protein
MDFVIFAWAAISLWKCRFRKGMFQDYMMPSSTAAVNGIFVILVFLRHFSSYITYGEYDQLFAVANSFLDQLLVTTFLFYSGYGVMISIITKEHYIENIPKRFLKVLIHFDIAIVFYIVIWLLRGDNLSISDVAKALIAWKSVGNSNWYIFAILCLYGFTFISGYICKNRRLAFILCVFVWCFAYIIALRFIGKSVYCYDTVLCYPVGMLYAYYAERINQYLFSKHIRALNCLLPFVVFVLCCFCEKGAKSIFWVSSHMLKNIAFVYFIVAVTVIIQFGNKALDWLGNNIFEIYILQRIPMNLFNNIFNEKMVYLIMCIITTILLSIAFKKMLSYVDRALFRT